MRGTNIITWSSRTIENETGRIIDFRQQGIFGKGTENTDRQCRIAMSQFCCEEGREALFSMILPIIREKLWPALVTVFGLAELKTKTDISYES